MIYLDSCALAKLVREEAESEALRGFLDERHDVEHVTSELARTELVRVVRRANHDPQGHLLVSGEAFARQLDDASNVLVSVSQLVVDTEILDQAGALESPFVRSLDAIHLASTARLGAAITEFVTYDKGLRRAAEELGMTVVAPN